MCSKHEAFGRVTAEAMFSGLLVIGNNSGGTPEIITDGVSGYLYDGTTDSLCAKMTYALLYPNETQKIVEQGYKDASKKFSTERYTDNVFKILKNIGI